MDSKTLCLGVLTMGDASGYEIRKQFEEGPFAHFHETSFGSIYPALTKLSQEDMVTVADVAQSGRPDKKVYTITEAGRAAFRHALHKRPAPDRIRSESLYMLFFANLLEDAHKRDVFDGYLDHYRQLVAKLEAVNAALLDPDNAQTILTERVGESTTEVFSKVLPCANDNHRQFTRGLGLAFYKTMVNYMEENGHLLFEGETR